MAGGGDSPAGYRSSHCSDPGNPGVGPRMPAPCLGEHTFEVLTALLEIPIEEAAELLGNGACG